MAGTAHRAPAISQAELESFHAAHFGQAGISHFGTNFLSPHDSQHVQQPSHCQQEEEQVFYEYEDEELEDDGLGYYDDGVKRTLTDEQIAMFRHSELEALRRAEESKGSRSPIPSTATSLKTSQRTEPAEPGELPSEDDAPSETVKTGGKKKNRRRRTKARVEPEKPDLRKRTWDVVDNGLASLDYGDEPPPSSTIPRPTQRRHISYDD